MTETVEQRIQSLEQHLASMPRSPFFAQLAAYYLDAGRTQEALNLCDRGLAVYPFYPTGHLIKGKALLALNMPAEARREFEFVQSRFVGVDSLNILLRNLPSGGIETFTTPPEEKPRIIKRVPTAQPVKAEPATPEAKAEEVLSQFTEPAAEAPGPEVQAAVTTPVAESAETFSFTAETPVEPAVEASPLEEGFGTAAPPAEPPAAEPAPAEPSPTLTGESFADFAERKRGELYGLENSMSLDDYLGVGQQTVFEAMPSAEPPTAEAAPEDPFAALTKQFEEPAAEAEPPQAAEPQPEQAPADPFARLEQLTQELTTTADEAPPEQAPVDPFAQFGQATEEVPTATAESPSEEAPVDPFMQLEQPTEEIPAASAENPSEEAPGDPFMQLEQPTEEVSITPVEAPPEVVSEDPFAQVQEAAEEPHAAPEAPAEGKDPIAELADKLKSAKRITPIIDLSERTPVPPSESETPSSTGFVTPTLAEIYAKQGWYDDAIKAYKTLALSKPGEREKFEKRIQELEVLKKQQESG